MQMKMGLVGYDRVAAIGDGRVGLEGIEFDVSNLAPSELFYKMLRDDEFDVAEMSMCSTLVQKVRGRDWTVLPIFPFRSLFHTGFLAREGITEPSQLRGGRIGLVEFGVTAALWGRGVLADDFGVDPTDVTWFVERSGELSHSDAGGLRPPEGVRIEPVPPATSLADMLVAGDLDAVLPSPLPGIANRFNRTDESSLLARPGITRLFQDPLAEARRYYQVHGFLHINHLIVVRDERVRERPSLPREVFELFEAAKREARVDRDALRRSSLLFSHLHFEEQDRQFGEDPFPYGVRANAEAVRTAIRRAVADGILPRPLELDELFVHQLLDT